MTADEKRAHLALHGCTLWRLVTGYKPVLPLEVRIMGSAVRTKRNLQPKPDQSAWLIGESTTASSYVPVNTNEIPDELLDRLDESLIERFLNQPETR